MRTTKSYRSFSLLFQIWSLSFLCYFLMFFAFRNNCSYLFQQVAQFISLQDHYELWDDQISSEAEIEKLEVVCTDIFSAGLKASPFIKELAVKNPIACRCNVLYVYLEILGPPPWHIA
ncbi:MAG: hypothetical protein JWM14_1176 [Chitinophagaceae bacterium]|nr:hypothetical protein [Chitinophagaceae bacterium]